MNDNAEVPNPDLRAYATEGAFLLSLSKTHLATLIALAQNDRSWGARNWLGALDGLKRRGLAYHANDYFGRAIEGDRYSGPKQTWGDYNGNNPNLCSIARLTRAGWLTYDLLVEAGLAPAIDRRSGLRRNIAA